MDNPVSHAEMSEMEKRLDAKNQRQNQRLNELEETVKQIHSLATSVEKLAVSIQSMAEAQKEYSKRLETLESRDGQMLRNLKGYIFMALASASVTLLLTKLFKF